MNSQHTLFRFKVILSVMFFFLFASNTSLLANNNDAAGVVKLSKAESVAIASKELSKKLKSDLVLKNVSLKFNKTERYFISDTQVGIKGEGTARLDSDGSELPLNFDVTIDARKHSATDVKYVFLNMEGAVDANSVLTPEDLIT